MKKSAFWILLTVVFLSSCATTKLQEGEELVKYKSINYQIYNKAQLSKDEVREDCDMLKYILYTCYAGIDESIALGLDLDAAVEDIYNQTLKKKDFATGLCSRKDFVSIMRQIMANQMHIEDQHLGIDGTLKDSTCVYYSKIYFEQLDDGSFAVKKSEEENVKIGQIYTGPQTNLYKMLLDGEIVYRFGVMTKIRVKTAQISVDNELCTVSVKLEDALHQKDSWNGIKSSENTLYISLSDCLNVNGLTDSKNFTEGLFEGYLQKVREAAKGKKNIIFDLRSNTGGYYEFPVKMLTAAYYFNHSDPDFIKETEGYMMNCIAENCSRLVSPFTMQRREFIYKKYWKNQFERLSDESKKFYKSYWSTMSIKPVRKFIPNGDYESNLTEFPAPDFTGTVYILLNRYSASAAELGTAAAFLLQNQGINVKIIGENSCGAVKYVGLWDYYLPNSSICLDLPSVIGLSPVFDEIPEFNGEGKGFYPDFWATSDNILETVVDCTEDKELETVLAGLGKEML